MKRILIPTDFSLCAQAATEVALEIAQVFKSHVYFLHISPDPLISHHVPGMSQGKIELDPESGRVQGRLNELVHLAERMGVQSTPVLVLSKGNDHIESYIKPYGIDWIIMGSHGATGIRELALGSKTERVVKHASVPVLVIKKRPKVVAFNSIAFASSFGNGSLIGAMAQCIDLARPYQSHIHLLYLNYVNRLVEEGTARERMKLLTNQFLLYSFTTNIIETNDAEWGIDEFVRKAGCDLVAITSDEVQGIIKMTSRHIALSLINHEAIPVLVLTAK